MKKAIIIFWYLSSVQVILAQRGILSVQAGQGFVLKHSERMGVLAQSRPYSFEMSFARQADGSKIWHKPFRYPQTGITAGFMDFRNPILGQVFYLFPFAEKTMLGKQQAQVRFKFGTGLVYVAKPFDVDNNFQNVAISSRFVYLLQGTLSGNFQVCKNWKIKTGLVFTHFSNASFTQPNAGVNVPSVMLGINYQPDFQNYIQLPDTFSRMFSKRITFNILGVFTVQEIGLPDGKKYWGANLISYIGKPVSYKSALVAGIDFFVNSAQKQLVEDNKISGSKKPDFKQAGITFGHELLMSRLSLLTQLGVYVYAPYSNAQAVYQRYGLKYKTGRRTNIGIFLKSHYGTAEYVEWGAGFNL
ncbi:MAG: acyloxyacyl hydrolase [Verrucomicrobia bacterium]|nr:acyloxyacyl hydrolase [Cytophagales bacterium]